MYRGMVCTIAMLFGLLVGGCASPWEANFEANSDLNGRAFEPTQALEVRVIESERLQKYSVDERKRRVESDVALSELPTAERVEAKNRLLETLQLKERGDEAVVLGWSEFMSYERLQTSDERLQKFGKKIGADYVVVASEYAGKVARVIERPMTTYSHGYTTGSGRRGGRTISYSDSSTTWVPTTEISDQYIYSAAFIRKARPGEN